MPTSDLNHYKRKLEQAKGKRSRIDSELKTAKRGARSSAREVKMCEEANVIIQEVAQLTQKELEFHISELVTLAMSAVFDDPYALHVEFIQKRGRTECELMFQRNNELVNALSATGGGAVDVASFALRTALWSLTQPKTRNVLLLDEPLKWLKGGELPEKGARMIKEISEKIGLQVIMVSHIPEQVEGADQVIEIGQRKGVSYVN
jgi:DNA repair exonuclease SbcCD ATPase subunit